MRHASFFSGVGGLDLGFERAGITTVSVCEIDPYASAVLSERFPGVPNLGNIVELAEQELGEKNGPEGIRAGKFDGRELDRKNQRASKQPTSQREQEFPGNGSWRSADVWSGGFPCQDLSVAGKRAGFAGKRSSLAFTYLDLVEQYRPRWLVLENVPGLLSSNQGRDFGRLIYEMEGLGYGVAWRTLDARFFGVPQRRRRVFIVGSFGTDRAGEVLFECEGCNRHFAPSRPQGQGITPRVEDGLRIAFGKAVGSTVDEPLIIGTAPNAVGNRAANGVARWVDYKQKVAGSLTGGGNDSPQSERIFPEHGHAPTLDTGRAIPKVLTKTVMPENSAVWSFPSAFGSNATVTKDYAQSFAHSGGAPAVAMGLDGVDNVKTVMPENPDLYPAGLDSHRYRCCGNGVVAPVAQWIGERLMHVDRHWREEASNG